MMPDIKTIDSIFQTTDTVNVVGNAVSMFGKNLGTEIDKHPVIRMNTIKSLDVEQQGTRWDYLATSNLKTTLYYNSLKVLPFHTFIFAKWSDGNNDLKKYIKFDCNYYETPHNIWRQLEKITTLPSTGLSLIWMLDVLGIDNVNVFGFDWKESRTYYHDNNLKEYMGPHNWQFEKEMCLDIIEKNGWNVW
jgi:hypothetical protein